MKIIFYLPVNTDKPKFVAFFLFVCMAALFIAQISSFREISSFRLLAPVAKQWIAKDIPSYWSQSKRTKIAIHVFGKYWKGLTSRGKNCNLRPKPWKCRSYWKLPFLVSHPFCMLSVAMHVALYLQSHFNIAKEKGNTWVFQLYFCYTRILWGEKWPVARLSWVGSMLEKWQAPIANCFKFMCRYAPFYIKLIYRLSLISIFAKTPDIFYSIYTQAWLKTLLLLLLLLLKLFVSLARRRHRKKKKRIRIQFH